MSGLRSGGGVMSGQRSGSGRESVLQRLWLAAAPERSGGGVVRPVILVGFVGAALPTLPNIQPDQSVIFVEEPDVVRKRDVRTKVAECPTVRELVEWEFHLPGKADEFYHAYRDLDPEAVIPLTEYATPFAARLAERYGLPGAGFAAATLLRDKALLRNVSRAAGSPTRAASGSKDRTRCSRSCGRSAARSCSNRPTGRRRWAPR